METKCAAKKTKKHGCRGRVICLILVSIAAVAAFTAYIIGPETRYLTSRMDDAAKSLLDTAANTLDADFESGNNAMRRFDAQCQAKAAAIGVYLNNLPEGAAADLPQCVAKAGARDVFVINESGGIEAGITGRVVHIGQAEEKIPLMLSTGEPFTVNGFRYYPVFAKDNRYMIEFDASRLKTETDLSFALDSLVERGDVETATALIVVNPAIDDMYAMDRLFESRLADSLVLKGKLPWLSGRIAELTPENLPGDKGGLYQIWGEMVGYCVSRVYNERYVIISITPFSSLIDQFLMTLLVPVVVFSLVVLAILIYACVLLRNKAYGASTTKYVRVTRTIGINKTRLLRMLPIALTGVLLLCLLTGYVQNLRTMAQQSYSALDNLSYLTEKLDSNTKKSDAMDDSFDKMCIERAQLAAWILQENPDMQAGASLQQLSDALQAQDIYLFNGVGRIEATTSGYNNYTLSDDPEDPSYGFWSILNGDADDIVRDVLQISLDGQALAAPGVFARQSQRTGVLAGTRRQGSPGLVRLSFSSDAVDTAMNTLGLEDTLSRENVGKNTALLVAEAATGEVSYWDGEILDAAVPAAVAGIGENAFQNNYTGYQTIFGENYYLVTRQYGELWICAAVERAYMMRNYWPVMQATLIASLLALLVQMLIATLHFGSMDAVQGEKLPAPTIEVTLPNGKVKRISVADPRWGAALSWSEKSPEQKYANILRMLCALGVVFVLFSVLQMSASPESRAIGAIINGQWLRGLNIFSVTTVLVIFSAVVVASWIARRLILQVGRSLGPHSETYCRLLSSTIKYVALIGTAFYCLNYIGIETETLVASAGVLSVIIGIGARSMVGDLLAGISIIFEGEFRVGDIITIGDWRGTVLEIGLRTTKVEDANKNIRIFNNASITSVVNMTQKYSYAVCDIGVSYEKPLEMVEAILQEEFPKIQARQPRMLSEPIYGGVVELGKSSVVLRITALCMEEDRIPLTYALNREIKLVFDKHHISTPFPQEAAHQPAEEPVPRAETTPPNAADQNGPATAAAAKLKLTEGAQGADNPDALPDQPAPTPALQ